jgi:hypothetical protein
MDVAEAGMHSVSILRAIVIVWVAVAGLVHSGFSLAAEGRFSAALAALLKDQPPTKVDLAAITPFAWEEMFIFDPKSSREDNCKVLELGWIDCRLTLPAEVGADEHFLVFRRKQQIIRSEPHARTSGDFGVDRSTRPQPVLREAARFAVVPLGRSSQASVPAYRLDHLDMAGDR